MAAWRKHERFLVTRWLRGIQQFWTGTRWSCDIEEGQMYSDLTSTETLADELEAVIAENYIPHGKEVTQ